MVGISTSAITKLLVNSLHNPRFMLLEFHREVGKVVPFAAYSV